ncbi:MAG TPA: alpha/beta hydrolase family protein [Granulicella sp.]
MFSKLYAKWMFAWETALTTRDTNRIVRPLEWGFDWIPDFAPAVEPTGHDEAIAAMMAVNEEIARRSEDFFGYATPTDFRLEEHFPLLYPTNVREETLAQDAEIKRQAAVGDLEKAPFLRFTSPIRTKYPENDVVNARWYPAPEHKNPSRPKQAIIVLPQWNADAFSHNALCTLFNRFGVSGLRLSKPYHDVRRPKELERSDYAVSSNIGRTLAAVRQAVIDIRCCVDWLQQQGYEHIGVLGTSLGSCYAFIAAAHDPRIRVCAFNHASNSFGDVVWTGQSTRHIRESFEQYGLSRDQVRGLFMGISPHVFMERFAANPKRVLVVHATYDLTFLAEFSRETLKRFSELGVDYVSKILPCGHYTTGETPYKYIDGWYLGSFVHDAFKRLRTTPMQEAALHAAS